MNKRELVGKIASDAHLTRAQASKALDAFIEGIQTTLAAGNRVTLSGFGTFGVSHRKARRVRNPQNGKPLQIAERNVPHFAAADELKGAIWPRMNTNKHE